MILCFQRSEGMRGHRRQAVFSRGLGICPSCTALPCLQSTEKSRKNNNQDDKGKVEKENYVRINDCERQRETIYIGNRKIVIDTA